MQGVKPARHAATSMSAHCCGRAGGRADWLARGGTIATSAAAHRDRDRSVFLAPARRLADRASASRRTCVRCDDSTRQRSGEAGRAIISQPSTQAGAHRGERCAHSSSRSRHLPIAPSDRGAQRSSVELGAHAAHAIELSARVSACNHSHYRRRAGAPAHRQATPMHKGARSMARGRRGHLRLRRGLPHDVNRRLREPQARG